MNIVVEPTHACQDNTHVPLRASSVVVCADRSRVSRAVDAPILQAHHVLRLVRPIVFIDDWNLDVIDRIAHDIARDAKWTAPRFGLPDVVERRFGSTPADAPAPASRGGRRAKMTQIFLFLPTQGTTRV